MEKKAKKKEKKAIKIGPFKVKPFFLVDISMALLLLIIIFVSPREVLIVTQKYNQGTEEQNNSVRVALGDENTEEKFSLYFQWYNVIHEVGHGMMYYNSPMSFNSPESEQMVNDFAYAYWAYYGGQDRLNQVAEIVNYAHDHIQNEEGRTMDYMEYAKKNWNKNSFYTFDNYGYFQFSSVQETFRNQKSLPEVLEEMGIKDYTLTEPKVLQYSVINKETSDEILNDAVENIRSWGLKYPDVRHKYGTNPYYSYCKPSRKVINDVTLLFDKSLSD